MKDNGKKDEEMDDGISLRKLGGYYDGEDIGVLCEKPCSLNERLNFYTRPGRG